jgi:hypothetical protein
MKRERLPGITLSRPSQALADQESRDAAEEYGESSPTPRWKRPDPPLPRQGHQSLGQRLDKGLIEETNV